MGCICVWEYVYMKNRWLNVALILLIVTLAIWIDFPILQNLKQQVFQRDVKPVLGLDLRGGMQVVLQAPEGYAVGQETLQLAASIWKTEAMHWESAKFYFRLQVRNLL